MNVLLDKMMQFVRLLGTMRRARAGIQNKKRPIGSFLFLGSTGVGKTETAKALAALFFGSEERMVRFDMSEFSGGDGLSRLLGTGTHAGALASALHEHPYCVLLLDEFEKADGEVHDLFLQILDEGAFTDARGTRVNARNTIIVATSNAGSARIWALAQGGEATTRCAEMKSLMRSSPQGVRFVRNSSIGSMRQSCSVLAQCY
jgi:ATP-dependent Clp protease ATP-binding subunit ClpA